MDLLKDCKDGKLENGLKWLYEPQEWKIDNDGLSIVPPMPSDFFRPYGGTPIDNGSLLYKEFTGDFTAIAHARAELVDFGDAAALTVRVSETQWAKLCLERSPIGETSIVTVVTNPWSDDCNGELVTSPECYLRLTRKGSLFVMHYSLDGIKWRFARMFMMEISAKVMVGIHAQAPFSFGCKVCFRSFSISPQTISDFRSGE
ncbi:MAG: DUF1349 domain-containing protein [Candidatus Omnitrophota bacterium]